MNAKSIAAVAHRLEEFPRCAAGMREGQLSLDQVGLIAPRGGAGSDDHYAALASVATVNQLRTAINLEPRPDPDPRPQPQSSITKTSDEQFAYWRIKLPHIEAAKFDAALASHRDALIAQCKRDRDDAAESSSGEAPPLPDAVDAFLRLVETSWDADVARRPHGHHTTVVVHLDVEKRSASLHLGPLLGDSERSYLTCDATFEAWFKRNGEVIGAGRTTRTINRRLRRALEPAAPSRRPHHHRHRIRPDHHRPRWSNAVRSVTGSATDATPTRRRPLSRTHRRTGRMVVVPTLPTSAAADEQLSVGAAQAATGRWTSRSPTALVSPEQL